MTFFRHLECCDCEFQAGRMTDAPSFHKSPFDPFPQTMEATCAPDITADRLTMPPRMDPESDRDLTHVNHQRCRSLRSAQRGKGRERERGNDLSAAAAAAAHRPSGHLPFLSLWGDQRCRRLLGNNTAASTLTHAQQPKYCFLSAFKFDLQCCHRGTRT